MYLLEAANALAHFLCLCLCFLALAPGESFREFWLLRNKIKILLCIAFALLMDLIFGVSKPIFETLLNVLPTLLLLGIILSKKIWIWFQSTNIISFIIWLLAFASAYYNFCELIKSIKLLFTAYV